MSNIRYFLNNLEVNPANAGEIQYQFNFGDNRDKQQLELSVSSLIFEREDYTRVQAWRATYGDYVGMPLEIKYTDGTTIKYLLDFTQDLVDKTRSIECKVVRYKGWDNFFDRAEGLAFQNSKINWVSSDFKEVDYLIVPEDLVAKFISLAIATFVLAKELAESIVNISEATTVLIKASVPVGGPIPGVDWGAIVVAAIKLLVLIAYTLAITLALTNLIKQLVELIFPSLRQFKAITYKNLIKKGVEYLGFTLSSTLLNSMSGLTVLPKPTQKQDPTIFEKLFFEDTLAFTNGYPSASDTIPTLSLAIKEFEKLMNAETRVVDGVVTIETKEFYANNSQQQILTTFNEQSELQDSSSINAADQYKRLVALYNTDSLDINTYDDNEGTVSEVSSEVINSPDADLELIKNYVELRMSFSRGTRKDELNWLEKIVKDLAGAIDLFTSGGASAKIKNRKGVMQISSQYFTNTKLLYMSGSKLSQNQNDFIGTDKIIERHLSDSIVNNQKDVFKNMPLAMTESEMFGLLANNFVTLESGEVIEVIGVAWSEYDNIANIDYTRKKNAVNVETITL